MNIEELREYVISKNGVIEGFPFGENTLVFKVKNKIFLLLSLDEFPLRFNVKCDPEKAIQLREEYPDSIMPGYHMSKKHWNTIIAGGKINDRMLKEMIDESYSLVSK